MYQTGLCTNEWVVRFIQCHTYCKVLCFPTSILSKKIDPQHANTQWLRIKHLGDTPVRPAILTLLSSYFPAPMAGIYMEAGMFKMASLSFVLKHQMCFRKYRTMVYRTVGAYQSSSCIVSCEPSAFSRRTWVHHGTPSGWWSGVACAEKIIVRKHSGSSPPSPATVDD